MSVIHIHISSTKLHQMLAFTDFEGKNPPTYLKDGNFSLNQDLQGIYKNMK